MVEPVQTPESGDSREALLAWLLDSDPSIRWQVMRDLMDQPDQVFARERARIATDGWGARLLEMRMPDGNWSDETFPGPGMGNTFALVLLKDLGLEPHCPQARGAIAAIRDGFTWVWHGNRPFFEGETEPCINGRVLAVGAYFGEASERLVDQLLEEQLQDGGWNCEAPDSHRSSFHTTINVLEGLLEYERVYGASSPVTDARARGQEYLLERRMFRRLSTGEVVNPEWLRFSFPPTYHYDVLRGLDYMRAAGVEYDDRMAEAIALVDNRRGPDRRWPMEFLHPDRFPLEMEPETSAASRWNTLRALRVLDRYAPGA